MGQMAPPSNLSPMGSQGMQRQTNCAVPEPPHQSWGGMQSLDAQGESGFSSRAQGLAGMADIVHCLEKQPWMVTAAVESEIARETGCYYQGQPCSTERHAEMVCGAIEGHKQLKRMITILARLMELHRHREPNFVRAFTV